MFEIPSPDRIIYRLVGALHADTAEMDLKGDNLMDLTPPVDRQILMERAQNYISHPCGAVASGRVILQSGFETPIRTLALPMQPRSPNDPRKAYLAMDSYGQGSGRVDDLLLTIPRPDEFSYVDIGYGAPE